MQQVEVGAIFEGKVTGITKFGAFIDIGGGKTGMVHISEVAPVFVKEIRDHLTENQSVKVKVINVSEDGKIGLSIKKLFENYQKKEGQTLNRSSRNVVWSDIKRRKEPQSFEDMMSKFKQASDEKMSDLKKVTESKRGGMVYNRRGNNNQR